MMWKRRLRDEDFQAEIEAHIALEADRLRAEGMSERDALAAANRVFGNTTSVRERFYESGRWQWLEESGRNLRNTLRLWRKRPLLTGAALATIALATGMNTTLFGIVWNVMLRPLPYFESEQLVHVWRVDRTATTGFTPKDRRLPDGLTFQRWQERSHSFDGLASYRPWRATIGSGGEPERVTAALVSADFFSVLRIPFGTGRGFRREEVQRGTDNAVILSHGYWQRRFGGQSGVAGSDIVVDGELCRVTGILAPRAWGIVVSPGQEPDVYVPISKAAAGSLRLPSGWVAGRLKRAVLPAAARDELLALAEETAREQGMRAEQNGVNITPLQEEIGYSIRPALWTLFAATSCVLLIACMNVANLLLALAATRRQELAVRSALGASRGSLVRQLLTEAFTLALAGAASGAVVGRVLSRTLVALYPGSLPRTQEGVESSVIVAFTVGLIVACTALFGVMPSLQVTRQCNAGDLRVSQLWMARDASRWRFALTGVQVALAVVLLVAAGLLLQTVANLRAIDLGFAQSRVLTAQVVLPDARYADAARQRQFVQEWVERVKSIPGVERAAITNSVPLAFNLLLSTRFVLSGQGEEKLAGARTVTGEYFDALGLQMKEGRGLKPGDDPRQDLVVVNEAFVRRFVPHGHAVGQTLRFGGERPPATIVGVVRDLRNLGLTRAPEPEMYVPYASRPGTYLDLVIRTGMPAETLAAALRAELRALDGGLVLTRLSTMNALVDAEVAKPRFQAVLLGLFAAVAMALAGVGVYGVVAQTVRARVPEFGVRAAMGATPSDLFGLVLRGGMRAPLVGLAAGLAIAPACGRLLESLLYGVRSSDGAVLSAAAGFVLFIALAACSVPGWSAARVDAARALRVLTNG